MGFLFALVKIIAAVFIAMGGFIFLPWHILLLFGLLRIRNMRKKAGSLHEPSFLFQITTVGTNPQSTRDVIDSIHESVADVPYTIWVVTEPGDPHTYAGAEKIVVPEEYSTPNGSTDKTRALHYSCTLRRERGLAVPSRWIILLDDDSKMTRSYFNEILKMDPTSVGGQGIISVRNGYGTHLFSSLADNIRPADCVAFCSLFNTRGNPMISHGEGFVVRADVESELGWDFGDVLSEDFLFGRKLARMYPDRFEWLNAAVEAKSPLSTEDFMTQRRRWFWGTWSALSEVQPKVAAFMIFRYCATFFALFSFPIWILTSFFSISLPIPAFLRYALYFNVLGMFIYYQVGCYFNTKNLPLPTRLKYHLLTFGLQYAIFLYEVGAFTKGFLQGKPEQFHVIRKS